MCDNHRGISLLSIAGKILARVLLNRLNEHLEQSGLLPESQCVFRKDIGTKDMIFTARQLQEKCQDQDVNLCMNFVRQFHDGMLARVQNDGEFSGPFPVTSGVKQGCVLASTLFSMMFSAMLTDAFQDSDNGIPIRYRFDGILLNLRRLQTRSKVQTEVLDEFRFGDDMAKCAPTAEKMALFPCSPKPLEGPHFFLAFQMRKYSYLRSTIGYPEHQAISIQRNNLQL